MNVTGFLLRGNSAPFHLEGDQKLGYHFPGSYFLSWDSVIAAFCWSKKKKKQVPLGLKVILNEEEKLQVKGVIVSSMLL